METLQTRQSGCLTEPKQKRARATRDRIFRSAERVFALKGFDGARIDEIASRAKVNKQRIYAYFGSKRNLYREILINVYSTVASNEGLMALSEADVPRMTGQIIDRFFEIHERMPHFWRLLSWENLNGGRSLSSSDWEEIRGAYIEHLEQLYTFGQSQGTFRRDVDFSGYLLMLFATTYFCFSNQMTISRLLNLELDSGEVRHRIEEQFTRVMEEGVLELEPPPEDGVE